jgi:crotonobetainyl-CoA:carnitine CoA-transferase CaiB-like acyl-CoA transferase
LLVARKEIDVAGALSGIKVLELANFISGPYAAMLLADLGAQVVKVELPGSGDPFRGWGAREGQDLPQFAAYNRGKQSITLNLQAESGREVCRRLAEQVDVLVENFRPGYLDRQGLGYETLREKNPGLIYCSITGMGSSGPYRSRPTYDAIATAMSGFWSVLTDMAEPKPVGPAMSDQLAGLYAAYGVLAALVARGHGGVGQRIECSMLSAVMAFMTEPFANYLHDGEMADRDSRPHRSQSYAFVAADGLPLAIHLSTPPKFWQGLAAAVGRPDLVEDPRFKTKADRIRNYDVLHALLADVFRTRPRAEWLAALHERDVPSAPIYNVAEALADPQAQHLNMTRTFGAGPRAKQLVGFPVVFDQTPSEPNLPPPELGEHTAAVLADLGYTPADHERMRGEGAI